MYWFDSRVRYSETDEQGRLSLTGILNYLQDCSTFQSEDLGIGIQYLTEHNRAWWVTSWQIIIDRYPCLGEPIRISTWPYDFKGIYGYRNFAIQDSKGVYLVRANSIWFFYDTEHQRPVRPEQADMPENILVREVRAEYKKAAVLGDYMIPRITKAGDGYVMALCDNQGAVYAAVMLRE